MWAAATLQTGEQVGRMVAGSYTLDLVRQGPCLVITFEPAVNKVAFSNPDRVIWGQTQVVEHGHSLLGVKSAGMDWYRGAELHDLVRSAAFQSFCAGFDRVVLYGSSMGAFAALVFASAIPGAVALAHGPQSTLDPSLVPWEDRWPAATRLDWRGDFADVAAVAAKIPAAVITYDPFCREDVRHMRRIQGPGIRFLRVPFAGHNVANYLGGLRVLKPMLYDVITGAHGSLSRHLHGRKAYSRYYEGFARHARTPELKKRLLEKATSIDPAREDQWVDMMQVNIALGAYQENLDLAGRLDRSIFRPANIARIERLAESSMRRLKAAR